MTEWANKGLNEWTNKQVDKTNYIVSDWEILLKESIVFKKWFLLGA